ncbi:hypothetical protein COT62_02545 [Candidatus Roizmanbacteria bacterium CG09_land_8_20_14_0_10_41_9]|uniref:rRNA maturation RNase YbeY n=1 Tax=Candidatus Roizmanbacteria bacterium CG09_land_8_20_14_0_10_41_9 TaxID=1974850 RepID=A0A2H0WSH9_9BACT|nr:MAG: hypothetical protein COT62_02545 [Candidatus Roizmanbacteria bacterium CG09_land_8_20_14_0_10_41_9]
MIYIVTSSRYKINRRKIRKEAQDILDAYEVSPDLILNIVFVGRNKMKTISKKYKNEEVALPVLSFDYSKEAQSDGKLMGEIVICYPQAILLAAERERRVDETITKLIRHGIENILNE